MAAVADDTTDARPPSWRRRHAPLLITILLIIVILGGFAAVPAVRHAVSLTVHGNLTGLRTYIRSLHAGGLALLFALILIHAVIPYPSEILTTTAGYVYGFIPGLIIAMVGWTAVAVLTYWIGQTIGRPVLRRILGRRFTELERGMNRGGIRLMLLVRLIPVVPLALLGYVAGATRTTLWRLTWTSFLGFLPLTITLAFLGSEAKTLSTSSPVLWLAVVLVVGLLVGSHFWAHHQKVTQDATRG
jgi:uncharacterized membrane protein YdjX (TVP38/TMEM64 family)